MTSREAIANLSTTFRQLSDALHSASVACKDLEYILPQVAAASTNFVVPDTTIHAQEQLQTPLGKAKHARDSKHLRRPPSAYLLFTSKARADLVKDHPELKATEIITKLGGLWSKLTDKQKRVLVHSSRL
jgi:hypothetical protein